PERDADDDADQEGDGERAERDADRRPEFRRECERAESRDDDGGRRQGARRELEGRDPPDDDRDPHGSQLDEEPAGAGRPRRACTYRPHVHSRSHWILTPGIQSNEMTISSPLGAFDASICPALTISSMNLSMSSARSGSSPHLGKPVTFSRIAGSTVVEDFAV